MKNSEIKHNFVRAYRSQLELISILKNQGYSHTDRRTVDNVLRGYRAQVDKIASIATNYFKVPLPWAFELNEWGCDY